nr:hypothetical protein [Tanacetum cinerariifolium]
HLVFLVFLVLLVCVFQHLDQNPSIFCHFLGLNLKPLIFFGHLLHPMKFFGIATVYGGRERLTGQMVGVGGGRSGAEVGVEFGGYWEEDVQYLSFKSFTVTRLVVRHNRSLCYFRTFVVSPVWVPSFENGRNTPQ